MKPSHEIDQAKKGLSKASFPCASIVIVNYNGYKWLKLCIPSLLKTDYSEFEIIIVDNGSTDQSIEYLRNNWQHRIKIIELRENLGFAEGCNIGIREAKGDIIALLNNDMEVHKDWLRAAVEALLSDEKVGAVQSKIMQHGNKEKIYCAGLSIDKFGLCLPIGSGEIDYGQYDYLAEIWGGCGGAMVGWKHVLVNAGLFDPSFFIYYDDVDLSWRIKLSGYNILLASSSVVYHVGAATTKSLPSQFVTFHATKNLIISWLKNYSLRTLILNWPILLFIVAGGLLLAIRNGGFGPFMARFRSIIWVLCNLNNILKERHKVQHVIRKKEVNDGSILSTPTNKNRRSSHLLFFVREGFSQKVKNAD
jgi:GT2 family glycosyltransferase